MKLVTFAKPQAPFGVGDTRLVPDDVATRLHDEGVIDGLGQAWPPKVSPAAVSAPQKPARPIVKPARPAGAPDRRKAS